MHVQKENWGRKLKFPCDLDYNNENRKKNKVPTGFSFLYHKAPTEIQRRKIIVIGMKKNIRQNFKIVSVMLKNLGKSWDLNPFLALQKPVVLPTVPWEPLEDLTIVSEFTKLYDTTRIRT